jgi:hypothetical protein
VTPVRLSVPVLVTAAVVAAGCGSSQPRLTQAQFTQQANAVCTRYITLVRGVMSSAASPNLASVQASVAQALPVVRAGNDELRSLRPPAELQDAYDRWLDASDRQVDGLQQLEDAVARSDVHGAANALTTLVDANAEQTRLDFASLGLTECGKASG